MKKYLLLFSIIVTFTRLSAQVDLHNSGILFMSGTSDILFINGSFNNSTGAALTNRGHLYITRDLTNVQAFGTITAGTLYLSGTSMQSVGGSNPFETFDLVTNNTAGFTLNQNLSVSGTHMFTNGIVTTSVTPNFLVYEAGSSYTGSGDNNHVNGWVKKLGNTNFTFPVGNGTVIRGATIESLSGTLEFNARYQAPNATATNVQLPLLLVDPEEYWTINRVTASGSARVHLNWDEARVNFPEYVLSAIRVAYYTGGLWTDVGGSATGDVYSTGDITSNSVSAFGNFTFASTDFLLPLRFVSLSAQRKANYNLVEWKAASATNTDHFEIERSEDGLHFRSIGTAISHNSISEVAYSFRDLNLPTGTSWYRIRCIDKDGKFTLSQVVSVTDQQYQPQSMYILNNPARGSIHIYAPGSFKGKCEYYLSGTSGQLIQTGTFAVSNAGNIFIRLHDGITPGVYILNIRNNSQHFREKLLIK